MLDRGAGGRRLIAMMQGLLRGSTIAGAALRGRLRLLPLAVAVLVFGLVSAQVPLGAAPPPEPRQGHVDPETVMGDPAQARLDYIENCGGCHGVNGDTVPAHLPELQGRVGWFMCTPEARAYLLRLPCGGGIDLLFTPRPDAAAIATVLERHARREPASIDLGSHRVTYPPALRLIALGHGEDLVALARLARSYGADVIGYAPATDAAPDECIAPIATRTQFPDVATDAWSAIVFLFHDRDWEEFLLLQALDRPAFYHGAVGSRRTHQARIGRLRATGVPLRRIDALRGSIGLIPGTRDPATLALSILAELVQDYTASALTPAWTPSPAQPA